MQNRRLLLIFAKNPILNQVKTRLAHDIGAENALKIYQHLLNYTRIITTPVDSTKHLYYANHIPDEDEWSDTIYHKHIQTGADLGTRMAHAFQAGFKAGYSSIVIIGTDCQQLTTNIIDTAFDTLNTHNAVIGPAKDGGYYLLGMTAMHPTIFTNKQWSTDTVCTDTIATFNNLGLSYQQLTTLQDVDRVGDLETLWDIIHAN